MIYYTILATLFTWGVTALGASLVMFFKSVNKTLMDAMLGFAAGIMISASFFSLISPALSMAGKNPIVTIGFIFGGLFLFIGDKIYEHYSDNTSDSLKRVIMLIFSITLHNIPEGMAIGVAFGSIKYGIDGATLASSIALALGIGIQNFPEGTAVSVPLLREGFSKKKAFLIGNLSGIVEPFSAIIGYLLVLKIRVILPFILAFAAGAMIYVVVEELIPTSQTNERKDLMALFTILGFSLMMILDITLS